MQATRQNRNLLALLLSPAAFWLLLFFVAPLVIVLVVSFSKRSLLGVVDYTFNLDNYLRVVTTPIYLKILWKSLWLAILNTAICLAIAYPFAFYIARQTPRRQNILIFLVMVPFWTNFLVRTYALIFILRDSGLINNILVGLGVISQPLQIMFTESAVMIGLVYGYLPFAVLPLYASIEQLDFNFVQAAQDLGANNVKVFLRVILPLTMPGVVAAAIITFIPTLGAYVTPDLMGGGNTFLIGNLLQQQFMTVRDWPFGSALGIILMVMVLAATLLYFRSGGGRLA
ncbi:MAG: Spermidine/putrescine transport system permease protein PotB [Anaerolineae bacterium]|nr:Spermidine/putrescine transport system permease protein PotB [Anaerolineae bacterium]